MRIKSVVRFLLRRILYIVIVLLIASAVLMGVARALTPVLNQYRDQVSYFASQQLHMPVTIEKVSGTWHWLQPMIKLKNVKIMQPDTEQPVMQVEELDIGIDLFKSLFHWRAELGTVLVEGGAFELEQQATGQWQLHGLSTTGKGNMNYTAVIAWLLNLDRIGLKKIDLTIIPLHYPMVYLSDSDLDLLTFGNRHLIEGQFNLRNHSTIPVELSARMEGSASNLKEMRSHFHILLQNIILQDWLTDVPMKNNTLTGNVSSLDIHGRSHGLRLKQLSAIFAAENIDIVHEATKKSIPIQFVSADVQLNHPTKQQWNFLLRRWQLERNGVMLPENNAQINLHFVNKNNFILDGNLNHIRLPDLQPLWHLHNPWSQKIAEMMNVLRPHGELQRLIWHVTQEPNIALTYSLQSNLSNLSWQAWQKIPGITNLNGEVQINQQQGAAILDGQQTVATFPLIFRKPITINNWNTQVNWRKQDNGWLLQSADTNFIVPSGQAKSQISLLFPNDGSSPVIDLNSNVDISQLSAADVYLYLPVGILSSQVVAWLDENILGIGETHASLVLKGKTSDFPFDKKNGAFIIQAQFKDAKLHLSPGWPIADNLVGNMLFSGRSMDIQVNDGDLSGAEILQADAKIPYMGIVQPVVLQIEGQAQGDASNAMQFLHQSPLESYLQQGLNTAQAKGPIKVNLDLTIPLAQTGTQQPSVNGAVQLNGVTANFPDWNIVIKALTGLMQFNQQGLSAQDIKGQLLGLPLNIGIVPPSAKNKQQIQINLNSILDIAMLKKQYNLPIDKFVTGQSPVTGQISIAPDKSINLLVKSNLNGIQVNLPATLKKTANQNVPLVVKGIITPKQMPQLSFTYGNQGAGLFQFATQPNYKFNAGNITFGSSQLQPLPSSGLEITGVFPVCSTQVWQNTLAQFKPLASKSATSKGWPSWLNSIALNCQQLILGNLTFNSADLNIQSNKGSYKVSVQSPQAQGTVSIPPKNSAYPIQIQFQRLYLNTSATIGATTSTPLNPSTLPLVTANIDDLRYGNRQFGQVKGSLQPQPQGATLTATISQGSALTAQLRAEWQANPVLTNMTGSMSSRDVSQALKNMGLPSNLSSQNAQANFSLSWPAAPYQIVLANLNGNVTLQLNDGIIAGLDKSTDAKVGFGRVLTMLSLQSLPDRLNASFSNAGKHGFNFTKISGQFRLQNGNAIIQQASLASSIAAIVVSGSINLANQTYDMNMMVTPHLTSSVPVAATLVGGPLVGMAAWVADKILSPAVNAIAQYQYKITGTWKNPVITKM